jgi:hypothetical protein
MKYLPCTLLLGALAFVLHAQTPQTKPAETPQPKAPADPFVKNANAEAAKKVDEPFAWVQCAVTLDAYAMDKSDAAELLATERGSAARYRRVLEMSKAGKARLAIFEGLSTKSGQRAVIEANDEVRYPVEYTPPVSAKGMATPTAWESRNVGDTFELEPVILPDVKMCDLNLVPVHTNLVGFRDVPENGGGLAVSQPTFSTQKITTSITTISGEPYYLGTMTPQTPQGMDNGAAASEIWLIFLHNNIVGPAPGGAKAKVKKPAEDHPDQGPAEAVDMTFSLYSVEREDARDMLVESTSVTAPWEKLQKLLAQKKARLEHLSNIKTKSGQRAVTEEIHEYRYISEYAAEHRVESTERTERTVTNRIGEKEKDAKPKPDSTSTSTETITTRRTDPYSEVVPGQPSAFETRNVGVTVEVEPVVGPDLMTVDLNLAVQSVKLFGNLKAAGIAAHYPETPVFEFSKITTSISTSLEQPVWVSTLNPPGADGVNDRTDSGRTYLLFVRTSLGEP